MTKSASSEEVRKSDVPNVKGVYMYGGVGCGKTMMMDILVAVAQKQFYLRRTHFHDFMLEVHTMLRDLANAQVRASFSMFGLAHGCM